MRLQRLLVLKALMAISALVGRSQAQCSCGLFLVTSQSWTPQHLAFSTGQKYEVNCSDTSQAEEKCRRFCEDEVVALNEIFKTRPHILEEYLPRPDLPCEALPAQTSSYYSACSSNEWRPSSAQLSSSVCCHPTTHNPVWCESLPAKSSESEVVSGGKEEGRGLEQTEIQRKIDTDTDQNAIENNEIEGSTKPNSDDISESWLTTFLSFFGYNSIGEMIREVDIFSLPGKIQSAMKTYNDEISMGQCYMEFTTYSVFKQDGVFANLLRTKRESEGISVANARATGPLQQSSPVQTMIDGLIGMLDGSPTTRQYADLIRQLMPFVMQVYASDDPTSAITSVLTQAIGPFLSQVGTSSALNPNGINEENTKPSRWPDLRRPPPAPKTTPAPPLRQRPSVGASDSSGSSPITSLILQLVKYYLLSPDSSDFAPTARPTHPPPTTRAPATQRPQVVSSASSNGIGNILGLLFGNGQAENRPRPKPPVVKKPAKPQQALEKNDPKSFVEYVLEFIRPVFISIVGKAPGESGVASIREVTRLSSLGRVDDTVVEEVLSPYFCLKNYVVNKAWTLTERGVSSVVGRFSPEEKARMMRMMKDDSEVADFSEWDSLK